MTRDEALKLTPELVAFAESKYDSALWRKLDALTTDLRKGQAVVVAKKDYETDKIDYVRAKVSSVKPGFDGPEVRVTADGCSWRVDGNHSFQPVK